MNKRVLIVLLSVLPTSCLKAADAADQEKQETARIMKATYLGDIRRGANKWFNNTQREAFPRDKQFQFSSVAVTNPYDYYKDTEEVKRKMEELKIKLFTSEDVPNLAEELGRVLWAEYCKDGYKG